MSSTASQIRRLERLREDALTELAMLRAQRATYEQDIARVREQRDAADRAAYERGLRRGMAAAKGFFVAASWSAMFHAFVWHFWDRTKGGDEFHRTMWKSHERLSVALDAAIDEAESEVA